MSCSNPMTFSILQDMANKSLDEASTQLKKTHDVFLQAQAQLTLLEQYYAEYQQRLNEGLIQGINKDTLANFQFFMGTVQKSIDQQKNTLIVLNEKKRRMQQSVYDCQKKVNAYTILNEKQQKILVQKENKIQQKQTDEFAHQQAARKSAYEHEYY